MMNKITKINKQLINNILGGLLLGSSIAMTTQAQAGRLDLFIKKREKERVELERKQQKADNLRRRKEEDQKRKEQAANDLKNRLQEGSLSLEECMKLVRIGGNGNVQGKHLTPLEEFILFGRWPEVRICIQNKTNVRKVSPCIRERYGEGCTLLHLAVQSPEEMKILRELCQLKRIKEEEPLPDPYVSSDVVDVLLTAKPEINGQINIYSKDKDGLTALDLARKNRDETNEPNIKKEYEKVIKTLINTLKNRQGIGNSTDDIRERKMKQVQDNQ
jgi:hypothetical protein